MSRHVQTPAEPVRFLFRDIVAKLFTRHERQTLNAEESKFMHAALHRLRNAKDQVASLYRFDEHEPPKDARFDAWGRCWIARTDSFQWERFPNCYMTPDGTYIGAKLVVGGLPDYAKGYRIEWWATVPVPPPFPDEEIVRADPKPVSK